MIKKQRHHQIFAVEYYMSVSQHDFTGFRRMIANKIPLFAIEII